MKARDAWGRRTLAAALLLLAGGTAPAAAQNHWGAVAASPGEAAGQAIEQPSRTAARAAAIQACQGRCRYLVTFYRSCAAIATGTNAYGWAAAGNVQDAGSRALGFCGQRAADCRLRIVACSGND
jgi:hypothetical protein